MNTYTQAHTNTQAHTYIIDVKHTFTGTYSTQRTIYASVVPLPKDDSSWQVCCPKTTHFDNMRLLNTYIHTSTHEHTSTHIRHQRKTSTHTSTLQVHEEPEPHRRSLYTFSPRTTTTLPTTPMPPPSPLTSRHTHYLLHVITAYTTKSKVPWLNVCAKIWLVCAFSFDIFDSGVPWVFQPLACEVFADLAIPTTITFRKYFCILRIMWLIWNSIHHAALVDLN